MSAPESTRGRLAALEAESHALWLACRDPRVPWLPKLVLLFVVAYALSPIDLIPDFIPVVGYLDDLVLLPLGIALAIRLMPREVLQEHRARAAQLVEERPPRSRLGAALVVSVWVLALIGAAAVLRVLSD